MKPNFSPALNPLLKADSVLGRIVAKKMQQLPTQLSDLSQDDLSPSTRSLFDTLSQPGGHFICEYKKASPTLGTIREHDTVETIVEMYAPFASAISVLTEYDHFKGELGFIPRAKKICQQPVLCKDFIMLPEQVIQARQYDADVVLLMLSVLSDEQYLLCAEQAQSLSIDVLTEVHNADELQRALDLNAQIIGINNRDLSDLSIDLATTERLVKRIPAAKRHGIRLISESGIKTRADIKRLAPLVDGFLIGSALMAEPRPDLKLRELVFSSTKICGLTNRVDADLAYMSGASLGGMILAQESKRTINIEQAKRIAEHSRLPLVGVFKDQALDYLLSVTTAVKLHAIQLHGNESRDYINTLKAQLPEEIQVWKTLHVRDHLPSPPDIKVDALLLENGNHQLAGGSGESFDWSLLKDLAKTYKDYTLDQIILAGGISLANISKLKDSHIQRIDLASGVESAPGKKDHQKLNELFTTLRQQVFTT